MNCWQFKKCGREKGGARAAELGVCPAYPDHGRDCAQVAGTLCGGLVQGTFAAKAVTCMKCDFYLSEHYQRPDVKQKQPGKPCRVYSPVALMSETDDGS